MGKLNILRSRDVGSDMAHILLLEDEPLSALAIERVLTRHGHTVTTLKDGCRVVLQFKRSPYDLILTDMSMPRADGTMVIRHVRRAIGASIPIIVQSGYVEASACAEITAIGADACLTKPLDLDLLLSTIETLLGQQD